MIRTRVSLRVTTTRKANKTWAKVKNEEGKLTVNDGCASRLGRKHDNKTDDETLPVRLPGEHVLPRHFVLLVDKVLLLDLLEFSDGKGTIRVVLVVVELLNDSECLFLSVSGDH